jgi:hypothetical protein
MTPLRIFAISLVRIWTRIYTAGLHAEIRERRRAEIESDLWESIHDTTNTDHAGISLINRLGRGIPADVFWRIEQVQTGGRMWTKLAFVGVAAVTLMAMLWSFSPQSEPPSLPKMPARPRPYYAVGRREPPPPPPPQPTWEEFVAKVNGKPLPKPRRGANSR